MWNVSQQVGDSVNAPNLSGDVELVSLLLMHIHRRMLLQQGYGYVKGLNVYVNGTYDPSLAYSVYNFQAIRSKSHIKEAKIDGLISPAKYYDKAKWTIAHMNYFLYYHNKETFLNLPYDNQISAGLRLELAGLNGFF